VAVGPDAQAERLVRAGKRLADGLDAEWLVVYVETPNLIRLSQAERNRRIDILRLASVTGRRGDHPWRLLGQRGAARVRRTRNVTRLLVGRSHRTRWRRLFRPSTTERLLAARLDIDVVVIGGDDAFRPLACARR